MATTVAMEIDEEKTEFKFDELSPEIQESVIESIRNSEWYMDYDWWESLYEMFQEDLKDNGYDNIKIWFSGFWCQGDGACFDGGIDADYFIKKWKKDFWFLGWLIGHSDFGFKIIGNDNHYCHGYTRTVESEINSDLMEDAEETLSAFQYNILIALGGNDYLEAQISELTKIIEEDRIDWCRKIYDTLKKEYYYLVSDTEIKDYLEANDQLFDKYGERI